MSMQVPAFLSQLQTSRKLAEEGQRGLGGNSVPYLSIKAQKFTAIDAVGDQRVVGKMDNRGIYADVIVVDLNPNVSKVFYASKFDPSATEFKAPDCWSDNGIGPSEQAQSPQSSTCASCPMNAWGSQINNSGKETKACNDVKKVGVLLDGEEKPTVFLLRIPPASLKNWKVVCQMVASHNVDLNMVKMRIRFDEQTQGVLNFELVGWIEEHQVQTILGLQEEKLAAIVGRNDKPKAVALGAAAQPTQAIAAPAPAEEVQEAPKRTRKPKELSEPEQSFLASAPAAETQQPSFGIQAAPPVASADLDDAISKALNFKV